LAPWADALRAKGHAARVGDMASGLHLLALDATGRWQAGIDPRREGLALGD
jgi:gamma-glutamyltranspeptidase/glutathione hydrolase